MKTAVFNLSKFRKQAYYEDAKGLMQTQSRSWMNCYKMKVDAGISPQKAINGCISEYQTLSKGDWAVKYASGKK
jgi:hypothetical protein